MTSKIQSQIIPTRDIYSTTEEGLTYVLDILYKAANIAFSRGTIDFPTGSEIHIRINDMENLTKKIENDQTLSKFVEHYNILIKHIILAQQRGAYNIKDGYIINKACLEFRNKLLPEIENIINTQQQQNDETTTTKKNVKFELPNQSDNQQSSNQPDNQQSSNQSDNQQSSNQPDNQQSSNQSDNQPENNNDEDNIE